MINTCLLHLKLRNPIKKNKQKKKHSVTNACSFDIEKQSQLKNKKKTTFLKTVIIKALILFTLFFFSCVCACCILFVAVFFLQTKLVVNCPTAFYVIHRLSNSWIQLSLKLIIESMPAKFVKSLVR